MSDAPFPATPLAEQIDTQFRAALARRFASLSPSALLQAASDWTLHLAASPGKRMDLAHLAMRQAQELASYTLERMNAGRDRPTRHGVQPRPRTGALPRLNGSSGPSTTCTSPSCSPNSGGRPPHMA